MQATLPSLLPLAGALTLLVPAAQAPDAPTGADDAQLRSQEFAADLDRTFTAMRRALQSLPRETFDVEVRAAQVGADPERAFAWVRDETRWIAYAGALRGARGVLLDRMGSHMDRALLLARLLESGGHEVELAHRRLSEDEARDLADIALAELPAPPDPAEDAETRIVEEVTRAAEFLDVDPGQVAQYVFEARARSDRLVETVLARGSEQSRALASALGWTEEEAADAPEPSDAGSLAALQDHWWVRVRRDDGWLDLDPSRRSHAPGDRVGDGDPSATYAVDDLPAESFHRLRVEVRAEQSGPDGRTRRVAMSHEVRTVDAVCETLTLAWVPIGSAPVTAQDSGGAFSRQALHDSALAVKEWLPILLLGDDLVKDASIRADGSINESPAMGMVGEAFARGLSALGEGADPRKHLTAVFLNHEVLAPGREPESYDRPVFDLLGAGARSGAAPFEISEPLRLRRSLALLGSHRILLQPSWPSQEFVLERWLTGQLRNRQVLLRATLAEGRGDTAGARGAIQAARPSDGSLLLLASQRRDRSPHADSIALTRLNLLGSYEQLGSGGQGLTLQRGFDILRNEVGVLPGGPHPARRVRLEQGVLDTVLEAELLDVEGDVHNASRSFAASLARGEEAVPILEPGGLEVLGDRLHPDSRTQIADALESGLVAVLAELPSDGAAVHWWRIDPQDGTCLGMGRDGRGQATEFIGLLSLGLTTAGGLACIDSTNAARMDCCMGVWFAGMVGEAALAIWLGGPVGAGVALAVAIFYSLWMTDACD